MEDPKPVLVYDPEDQGEGRLLPQFQLNTPGGEMSFVVMAEALDEHDRGLCLFMIIKKPLFFEAVYYILIHSPNPFADDDPPVLDLLIICIYGIVIH